MIIGVFGLPRSGTNFMEWSLNNNFKDIEVPKRDFKRNDVEPFIPKAIHTKHCYPNLDGIDGCVVIYKKFDEWVESLNRFKKTMWFPYQLSSWESYIYKANLLPKDKCLILEHSSVVLNYEETMLNICSKFGCELKEDWKFPIYRFDDNIITNILYDKGIRPGS
jgi:hypothetical protein